MNALPVLFRRRARLGKLLLQRSTPTVGIPSTHVSTIPYRFWYVTVLKQIYHALIRAVSDRALLQLYYFYKYGMYSYT